eukprot:GCRY01002691.1.p1 GENE.GCRY01002691.1~~GCRY01002691.1.p1  ORF type:complete len:157 (+),score=14.14 GCRY01002691.1:210-680(+)
MQTKRHLSCWEVEEINEIFVLMSQAYPGYLTKSEFKKASFLLFGKKHYKFEIKQLFQNNNEVIDQLMFFHYAKRKMEESNFDEKIREMFLICDSDRKGYVAKDDFVQLSNKCWPGLHAPLADVVFQSLDGDNDGRVSFREFARMLRHSSDQSLLDM